MRNSSAKLIILASTVSSCFTSIDAFMASSNGHDIIHRTRSSASTVSSLVLSNRTRPLHMSTLADPNSKKKKSNFGVNNIRIDFDASSLNDHASSSSSSSSSTTGNHDSPSSNKRKKIKKKIKIASQDMFDTSQTASNFLEEYEQLYNTPSKKVTNILGNHIQSPRHKKTHTTSTTTSSTTKRFTKEQEIELTLAVQKYKHVKDVKQELISKYHDQNHLSYIPNPMYKYSSDQDPEEHPTLDEWADACLLTRKDLLNIIENGREARAALVAANAGLVLQAARKYDYELKKSIQSQGSQGVGTILTLNDLVQEGNMGIMEAAERFEKDKGARFSTYAGFWVKQRIIRAITENSRVIRLPAHVHNSLRAIRKAMTDLKKVIGREPSLPELAHHLDMPLDKLQLYTDSSRSVVSLNCPLSSSGNGVNSGGGANGGGMTSSGGGGGSKAGGGSDSEDKRTIGDKIASDALSPEEDAQLQFLKKDVREVIDGLGNDRERDVLYHRFGLEGGEPCTLEETGRRLGISRERVRVIENRALNKLRQPSNNYRLKEYIEERPSTYKPTLSDKSRKIKRNEDIAAITSPSIEKKPAVIDLHGEKRLQMNRLNRNEDTLSQQRPEQIWSF